MKSIYIVGVLGLLVAFFAASAHISNQTDLVSANSAANGAFRDGAYLGSLAARHADTPHIASGRWATAADRQYFTEGYTEAYNQTLAVTGDEKSDANNNAAFRDGLYLGQLDAAQGRPEHIGAGRWAQPQDRQFFTVGYRQAYADTTVARAMKVKEAQTSIVR